MAVFPKASLAVTVKLCATPAVVGLGKPLSTRLAAAAALTTIPLCVPVMEPATVSVAVIDCAPAVFNVPLNACTPASPTVKV